MPIIRIARNQRQAAHDNIGKNLENDSILGVTTDKLHLLVWWPVMKPHIN